MSQRTKTKLPTRDEQKVIQRELGLPRLPDAAVAGPQPEGQPDAAPQSAPWEERYATESARWQLAEKLGTALDATLKTNLEELDWKKSARRLPMTSLAGAAEAAKTVVTNHFAAWTANAPIGMERIRSRRDFTFTASGPAPTLVDITDVEARAKVNRAVSPASAADYLMGFGAPRDIAAAAKLDPFQGSDAEKKFYQEQVRKPFVETHLQRLEWYDRFGFSMTDPTTARIFVAPTVRGWKSTETEEQSFEVWQEKWEVFKRLVHEFVHVLEHPNIPEATGHSATVREGFCELLAAEVIRSLGLNAEKDADLRDLSQQITGSDRLPSRSNLSQYAYAPDYRGYVDSVVRVRDIVGYNAIRAVYFQGHLEFIGLDRLATWLPGAQEFQPGTRRWPLPLHMDHRDATWLAQTTGTDLADLRRWNPAIDKAWIQEADEDRLRKPFEFQTHIPGFRTHFVILAGGDGTVETWDQIAAQHGTSADRLRSLNRFRATDAAPAMQWILAPES